MGVKQQYDHTRGNGEPPQIISYIEAAQIIHDAKVNNLY